MNTMVKTILNKQMKILFRGEDSSVPNRNISSADLYELRCLDIELMKNYMPYLDHKAKERAEQTIRNLEKQLSGIRYSRLMH